MKFEPPVNENYCATVVRIKTILTLDGLDNLVGVPFFGYQALTSKEIEVDDLRILFTAETQLSEEYARLNNLHRHGDRNDDESVTGYLEDNRRVKAIRLRGNRSSALLMPLASLAYTGVNVEDLVEGATFDRIGDHEICNKYVVKTRASGSGAFQTPKAKRIDEKFLPQHFDTANYWRNSEKFSDSDFVTITQKLHGTSIRAGHTVVSRKLRWIERVAKRLGVNVSEREYAYVFGSRKVIKDPNNPDQNHFYGEDVYTREGKKLEGLLPAGYVVYGELIGFVEGKTPIQKGYTYNVPEGETHLYVYRVVNVNPEGVSVDLSWTAVKEFCAATGLKHVPELWSGFHMNTKDMQAGNLIEEKFMDTRLNETGWYQALPLSDPKTVDEGVCLRREGITPLVLKAKSPQFLEHETKLLDKGEVDLEEEQIDQMMAESEPIDV